jgi:hypothetical protein
MRRALLAVATVAALGAVPAAYAALLPEQAVFSSPKNERIPAADRDTGGTDVWAFARSRTGHPNLYDAYAKVGSNTAVKLNTSGQGFTGGIDYPTVVYQRVNGGRSNIFLYDLSGPSRPATPAGVNTTKWEWHPTISGNWLLFGRDNTSNPTQRVILHDTSTGAERILSIVMRASQSLLPGQVNGDWVTYTRCAPVCNVARYRISTATRATLHKPATSPPRHQYAGSVTPGGVVYLIRSGPACGASVKIVRYDPARDGVNGRVVAALPAGKDVFSTYVRENTDGSVNVFHDRVSCRTGRWDVYKVTDPAP